VRRNGPVYRHPCLKSRCVCSDLGVQFRPMMDQKKLAIFTEISLGLAAVFWGANYAATKYAAEFMPPLLIVAVRFTAGGILMYCLLRIVEPADRLKPRDLLPVAGLGCLGVAIGQTAFTFGVSMTSAANTGLIFATAPIWGLLLGLMLGLERPAWRGVVGVGLSILGVFIVFFEGLGAQGTSLAGDLFVLLAAMAFGSYTVLSMLALERHSPLTVATYSLLFGGLVLLLLSSPYLTSLEWEASGPEHGQPWPSPRSSPLLSLSRHGKQASPASGPIGFWSTSI
jgi:drug/metabolite transporter (DMT)-like permease